MVQGQKANYQNTIIYKIVCNDLKITDCYVGHTTNWVNRKSGHKTSCINETNKSYNQQSYKIIRNNGGWDNWSMIEICKYPCNDKREAEAEERRHYELLNSNLNSIRPITHEVEKKEQKKIWNLLNKDKLKECREHKKEQKIEYDKNYYEKNKKEIKEKYEKKVKCECGCELTKQHLTRHKKSKKHWDLLIN